MHISMVYDVGPDYLVRYAPEEPPWVKIKNPRYNQIEWRHELFEKRAAGV